MKTDNELIAEFMGLKRVKGVGDWITGNVMGFNAVTPSSALPYSTSWDWLMPVVEKIQSLGFKFIIGDSNRVTVYNKDYDWRNGATTDSLIMCVWYGVVEFIKWYNQQKK